MTALTDLSRDTAAERPIEAFLPSTGRAEMPLKLSPLRKRVLNNILISIEE